MSKKVIAVVGPTGSGKTALAISVAKIFNGVLISADSRQVYRGLDIGTNKEGAVGEWHGQRARIVDGVPQLLVDIVDPGQRFTLNDWLEKAHYVLNDIMVAGQLPIIVGGTGLYITALLEGYELGQGRGAKVKKPVGFESLTLQIEIDREILNQKSDERFPRIYDSLLAETRQLLAAGVDGDWLNKIGLDYRYVLKDITGELTRQEAISEYQKAARAYIKRQLTWWRHHGQPINIKTVDEATQKVRSFV